MVMKITYFRTASFEAQAGQSDAGVHWSIGTSELQMRMVRTGDVDLNFYSEL